MGGGGDGAAAAGDDDGACTHAISTPLPRNLPTPPQGQNTLHALRHRRKNGFGVQNWTGRRHLQYLQNWHLMKRVGEWGGYYLSMR